MSAGPITPGDIVIGYGILAAIAILSVLAACFVLLGLKWLGGRDR